MKSNKTISKNYSFFDITKKHWGTWNYSSKNPVHSYWGRIVFSNLTQCNFTTFRSDYRVNIFWGIWISVGGLGFQPCLLGKQNVIRKRALSFVHKASKMTKFRSKKGVRAFSRSCEIYLLGICCGSDRSNVQPIACWGSSLVDFARSASTKGVATEGI